MIRTLWVAIAVVAAAEPAATQATASRQQAPVFRTYADAVLVDVAVTDGHTPVSGLGLADFELTDNGIKQTIRAVTLETLPVDVSLVVDTSGSVVPVLEQFTSDVRSMAGLLRSTDRIRVISVATGVILAVPLQPAGAPITLDALRGGGVTALNDGLLYALVQPTPPNRRQIIVALTDGGDNWSWLDSERLPAVASRADAVFNVFIAGRPAAVDQLQNLLAAVPSPFARAASSGVVPGLNFGLGLDGLIAAARATGGDVYDLPPTTTLVTSFAGLIEQFRRSYLLAYVPSGVKRDGWHDLTVKVPGPKKYVVRARSGYAGG